MVIRVYDDEGVVKAPLEALMFELSEKAAKKISSEEIIHSPWEKETKLLLIPGGRDIPYHDRLKGRGNDKIRTFVENGGAFLGICAGGYYGCKSVEFDKGGALEVLGERELAFFPGIARGPAYGPGTFFYDSERGSHAASISSPFSKEALEVYFNGGCYFHEADKFENVQILSKYLDIPETPAAIVECKLGKGKAILSGVHFEIGTTDPKTALLKKMRKRLIGYEDMRKTFFRKLLDLLL